MGAFAFGDRWKKKLGNRLGIKTKQSMVHFREAEKLLTCTYEQRMHVWNDMSKMMVAQTVSQLPKKVIASITHVIVISVSGVFTPGLPNFVQDHFDLPTSTKMYGMSDAGCLGGVRGLRGRRARRHRLRRVRHVEQLGALGGVLFRDEPLDELGARTSKVGVGVKLGAVGEGELLGLDVGVQIVCRVEPHRSQVVQLEDIEHLEGGDALRIGWQLVHAVPPAIRRRDGGHPLAVVPP